MNHDTEPIRISTRKRIDPPVAIEAENIPPLTQVEVRVVSRAGLTNVFESSPLVEGPKGVLTGVADVTFEPGYSLVQLRAEFGNGGGRLLGKALPRGLRDLKTLNGERIKRVEVGSTMGRATRMVYVTETGRKIPVDGR